MPMTSSVAKKAGTFTMISGPATVFARSLSQIICLLRRSRCNLHLAAVDEIDWRVKDHLISRLHSGVHFDACAQIALHPDFADLHRAVARHRDLHSVAVEDDS